jgi:hypothetical protein
MGEDQKDNWVLFARLICSKRPNLHFLCLHSAATRHFVSDRMEVGAPLRRAPNRERVSLCGERPIEGFCPCREDHAGAPW